MKMKFHCLSVTEIENEHGTLVYNTLLSAADHGDGEEHFFAAAAPQGKLELRSGAQQDFQAGKDYLIEVTEAPASIRVSSILPPEGGLSN